MIDTKGFPAEWDDMDGDMDFEPLPEEDFAFIIEDFAVQKTRNDEHQMHVTLVVTDDEKYEGRKVWYNCGLEGKTAKNGSKAFGVVQLTKEVIRNEPEAAETMKAAWGELFFPEKGIPGIEYGDDGSPDLQPWIDYFELVRGQRVEAHLKQRERKKYVDGKLVNTGEKDSDVAYFLYKKEK